MKAESPAFAHLDSGGLLIVQTRETARALRYDYDRAQRLAGRSAWSSARIRTLDDWLVLLWQELRAATRDRRILRSDAQLLRVLGGIIEADARAPILNGESTARAILRSWQRMHAWYIDLATATAATAEEECLRRWTLSLRNKQRAEGWVDRAQLSTLLASGVPRSVRRENIALLGFDPVPPATIQLVTAFEKAGATVARLEADRVSGPRFRHTAANEDEELVAAATWARARLEASPDVHIAIVIPDLAARRPAVRAIFDRVIDPSSLLPTQTERLPLYSMIGGDALGEHAIVACALRLLRFADTEMTWDDAGQLLRSPYLDGWDDEAGPRARLDREIRKDGRVSWSPLDLARLARAGECERWSKVCLQVRRVLGDANAKRRTSDWAQRLGKALGDAGWPQGRDLASGEFQAADRLRELVAELAGLDPLLPSLDLRQARRELERLARETGFQPESGDPPLRVLDTVDHPGPAYDALWVSGLTASRWPPTADPDPFLPIDEQHRRAVPWVSAAARLAGAERAMQRLLGAAEEIVFSWPARVDESESEPSALIPSDLASLPAPQVPSIHSELTRAADAIEVVEDPGTALPPSVRSLPGGARVLELQAKCPFRAFGELRLHAIELESPRPGIARQVRGLLAHRVLEALWREIQSQSRLRAMPGEELKGVIQARTRQAFAELAPQLSRPLLELEQRWLEKAVAALLEKELGRAPFRVLRVESKERHEIGGMALDFRIDRIDELEHPAGAGEFIVDYKTGRSRAPRWFGDRRDMPQLPAYAVTRTGPVAGIAFAELNLREPGFRGLAANDDARQGLREPRRPRSAAQAPDAFASVLADWRDWTFGLVAAHVAGDARVRPISAETCRTCALAGLCRIGPDVPSDDESNDVE